MKKISVLDRILLLITGLLAAYQIVSGVNNAGPLATTAYTIAFGVLLVAGLLIIILGFEISTAPRSDRLNHYPAQPFPRTGFTVPATMANCVSDLHDRRLLGNCCHPLHVERSDGCDPLGNHTRHRWHANFLTAYHAQSTRHNSKRILLGWGWWGIDWRRWIAVDFAQIRETDAL